jgi:predicted ATPase
MNAHPWSHGGSLRVRMGMHTGEGRLGGDDYLGIDVNRAARIAAAGRGGQVLMSEATRILVADDLPAGVIVRDLGEHRLKDFDQPTRLHDLVIDGLPAEFPSLNTLEIPTNLPVELTSFVGREQELEKIRRLLGLTRLLTLTGPGGSGKTRLALRVASDQLDRYPDGVFFVELASVNEPHLVPSVIASALRTGEQGPLPILETLQIELRQRTALLVLDNFEQVIEASPTVGALLSGAPRITMLVTSRGPLRIQGEQEFSVPPLELPDAARLPAPEELAGFESVALFVERALAIEPNFILDGRNSQAVVEICRRLDGLPLAIELAASRLRLLSPPAILERLDRSLSVLAGRSRDLPERQRTLRGAISWSYDLLAPEIAALFRRMCVFAGGFSIAAAESVCDPDGELEVLTLEGLEALLDTSLVRRKATAADHDRFETLQTVREYGLERLVSDDDAPAVKRRHAHYFLDLAERIEPGFRGPDLEHHLQVLDLDHDNLRAALTWVLERDEGEVGLRLVSALWRFWHLHGDLTAGLRWADEVLALPSAVGRTTFRAHALLAGGSLAYWQLAPAPMLRAYEEGLAIFRELDDHRGIALATYDMGFALALDGEVNQAAELLRSSRAMFEELGEQRGVGDALFGLSIMSRLQGNPMVAQAEAEEALQLHKDLGDLLGIHGDLYVLGSANRQNGNPDRARDLFLETMGMAEHMENPTGITLSLDNLAHEEIARGNPVKAMRLGGASEAIKESVGGEAPPELIDLPDLLEAVRPLMGEEEIRAAWEEGRRMSLEEALAYAREDS